MNEDKEYWSQLTWPATPNADDVEVYRRYCRGQVLLLGSTRSLLPLAHQAWDINPVYDDAKIVQRDWFTLDQHWNTIIVDGALSYGKEFTQRLLPRVLEHCDRFVSRTFLNPSWPTKYAVYFPKAYELTPVPREHTVDEVYSFYIWDR